MRQHKKATSRCFLVTTVVVLLAGCLRSDGRQDDPRGAMFVGSMTCKSCHKDIYESYLNTTHHMSTTASTATNVSGSFKNGENAFAYNAGEKVVMENRDSGLFQVAYLGEKEVSAYRFDITFGMKNAQTYLHWNGDKAYELPVSKFTAFNGWATSPGFPADHPKFDRSIGSACFECHASYVGSRVEGMSAADEVFDKNSLVLGIDCERCHGGSANHVNYHEAYPDEKQAKYMVARQSLSRQQRLDMCATCHSGNTEDKERSTFNFKLGDTLANFYTPWSVSSKPKTASPDVHGDQFHLLAASQCFIKSNTLTCTTCHDPHTNASPTLADYNSKCVSCHPSTTHAFDQVKTGQAATALNCVPCHMPAQASQAITYVVNHKKERSALVLRTHKIAVYQRDETKVAAIINFIKDKRSTGMENGQNMSKAE